jgi:hypothetical protein
MFFLSPLVLSAEIRATVIPSHLSSVHPRIAERPGNSQTEVSALAASDPSSAAVVAKVRDELRPYLEHVRQDPMWVASRLQMYWKSHATDIYNRGDVFDHTEGHAPVATVRYPGSRNPVSIYRAPRLEDIPPYEDDTRGVWLVNSAVPGRPLEWASPSKAGRVVDGINSTILQMAGDAAELGWITGDEEYTRFAFTIFDTYMRGMYYRNEPIDMNHGHSQTIYGMSTFEVIQEGVIPILALTYDFLFDYIQRNCPYALPIYADTFRKWIGVTIHNGVPFNNWDLIEARFILSVALILEDDSTYPDHRGAQYYLNQVLNQDSVRQWSLQKLAVRGFDSDTGVWFESPGYSMNVVNDFIIIFNQIDRETGTDLLQKIPVVRKAVAAMVQYAFPNGITVSWGDSYYKPIATAAARQMVLNARMHHRREDEVYFTGMVKLLDRLNGSKSGSSSDVRHRANGRGLESLFDRQSLELDPTIPALRPEDVLTATFSAPSVSYFVQRNGLDPITGLMISEAGSLGNHQHANGITVELYGMGLPLAPDSGIGTNYFEADHNEYYAQFPAHNTVVVDGISSYPTMMSHHGFNVNGAFPVSNDKQGSRIPVTYADVSFLEPETNADQRRVTSTVRISPDHGYYIDIFRSRRRNGNDRENDYFFHGLGQTLDLIGHNDKPLAQTPTEELTFANEELTAYDYFWNKLAVAPSDIYHAIYRLQVSSQPEIQLHAWIAGADGRQLFSVLAPPTHALRTTVPEAIAGLPLHTLVVRQKGEAWNYPFVSIFEPARADLPATIKTVYRLPMNDVPAGAVALCVEEEHGRQQTILSTASADETLRARGAAFKGSYAVIDSEESAQSLLLGEGSWIESGGLRLELDGGSGSAFVARSGTHLNFASTRIMKLLLPPDDGVTLLRNAEMSITGRRVSRDGRSFLAFTIPATKLVEAELVR